MLKKILIIAILCSNCFSQNTIDINDLTDKLHGMWLAQLIGNYAGRPTEGDYSGSTPNPDPCVPWKIPLPSEYWSGDDDTDIEYIAIHTLEADGFDCNNAELSAQWLQHSTSSGLYIANRQAWFLINDGFLPPQTGSRTYNMHWYAIDNQITTETLGAISPGLPQAAIDLTAKFGKISNQGFPVHAAQFYAAMYAEAYFVDDVNSLIQAGLKAVPTTSRTRHVIEDVNSWYLEDINDGTPDWRATRKKLYNNYCGENDFGRYYNWIESTVNTGATVLALLYGQGDFKQTVQIAILAGWDSDCNPATAAGLIGIINGFTGLPSDLTDPAVCSNTYINNYRQGLPDPNAYKPQTEQITSIAQRLTDLAIENIISNGGHQDTLNPDLYHIPASPVISRDPNIPDPNMPSGLAGQALNAGIDVWPSAKTGYFDTNDDRRNLYGIIDGITTNIHNGHRPYYSYTSQSLRDGTDWYQVNFSQYVLFEKVIFYEGDLHWAGINTYYKDDDSRGGFFQDLTVQILRDGKYITPANLTYDTPLDRYKMYQKITYEFAPTAGAAIRIKGTPGGSQQFTTIMELEPCGDTDPGLFVESTVINDRQLQRSKVDRIDFTFNEYANISISDFNIINTFTHQIIESEKIQFTYNNNSVSIKFDIDGDADFSDYLPDGIYKLQLNCQTINNNHGQKLLDDDRNPGDGSYTVLFHCLYGDADGNALVDFSDMAILSSLWLAPESLSGLDCNEDNILNLKDLSKFAQNWKKDFNL